MSHSYASGKSFECVSARAFNHMDDEIKKINKSLMKKKKVNFCECVLGSSRIICTYMCVCVRGPGGRRKASLRALWGFLSITAA